MKKYEIELSNGVREIIDDSDDWTRTVEIEVAKGGKNGGLVVHYKTLKKAVKLLDARYPFSVFDGSGWNREGDHVECRHKEMGVLCVPLGWLLKGKTVDCYVYHHGDVQYPQYLKDGEKLTARIVKEIA